MKSAILYLDVSSEACNIHVMYENRKLVLVSSEAAAEKFFKKLAVPQFVFYGLIPDPTKIFNELKKDYYKEKK